MNRKIFLGLAIALGTGAALLVCKYLYDDIADSTTFDFD